MDKTPVLLALVVAVCILILSWSFYKLHELEGAKRGLQRLQSYEVLLTK